MPDDYSKTISAKTVLGRSRVVTFALCLGLVLSACGRSPDTPERQIEDNLSAMSDAVSDGNVRALFSHLAEDFGSDTWDLDRQAMRLLVQREMRASARVTATVFDLEIHLTDDDRARADFQLLLTGGTGLIPNRRAWYRVQTGWREDQGEWKLISAAWESVLHRN